ncbi:uncharacterized protein LOC113572721 isoform X1 [Electrophorus electricus]|uniref:uncharacterized protein LOC113572721 isoform X1 n=1 Tax=Electrophorus electricus TaxID=8005 RepID=UPI000F0A5FBB|nr:uncharacterized protein LOC113572721 isoform X1 [Electrophorus electricus]XP_026858322.1 uncharacterized protein LOC113572721 isoform X1 [Electrophorus electricus]XP_026858323.1 uncharacterized protein LOC113572721 isoform X1 [Electrophorus electricus]
MQGVSDVGSAQFGFEVRPRECIPSQMVRSGAVESYGYQLNMKTEPHMFHTNTAEEVHFLRSRVHVLEREKAEMAAENRRLKDLLVKEIPHLLSTMWQTLTSSAGQANHHHHSSPAMSGSGTGALHGYSALQYKDQSCSLPSSLSAAIKGVQHEMIMETGSFGHKMAGCHNGADGVMFEPTAEVDGALCTAAIAEDDQNLYLSSPCSTSDSASSCNEHRPLAQTGTPIRQVEVCPGSGIFCAENAWRAANMARSPTAMVRALLLGVFDKDTLLNSNLRGGRSRRPSYTDHLAPLDPDKLNAIYNATLARFPLARKGQIGTGINSKLSEMRFRSRRVKRDRSVWFGWERYDISPLTAL